MTLIVFFRGINVGGHRRFRPSVLAKELSAYDVVNVGAAGTLVVRKPGSRAKFLAVLRKRLPFEAEIAWCAAADLLELEKQNPFAAALSRLDSVRSKPADLDLIQFVSILSRAGRGNVSLPTCIPSSGRWFVRVSGSNKRLIFGHYRRHMKTIGYLGQIDKLFGAPATTRSWSTICSVLRILKADRRASLDAPKGRPSRRQSG
jgi:uncharacterized protein (DUF1697 family)